MLRQTPSRKAAGFSLIELLTVTAILSILAAMAIVQFGELRSRGFNARAQSDLRNAVTAQEAAFVDREQYADCSNDGCNTPALPGFHISPGVELACTPRDEGKYYQCSATHPRGTKTFYYDNQAGGFWTVP